MRLMLLVLNIMAKKLAQKVIYVVLVFDGIKNITSGEGGCIVSSDADVLSKIKDSRLLGVENDTENRFEGNRTWDPDVKLQGWRYHMSDLMAAIGREQLKNFNFHKSKRQSLAKLYTTKNKRKGQIIKST